MSENTYGLPLQNVDHLADYEIDKLHAKVDPLLASIDWSME